MYAYFMDQMQPKGEKKKKKPDFFFVCFFALDHVRHDNLDGLGDDY